MYGNFCGPKHPLEMCFLFTLHRGNPVEATALLGVHFESVCWTIYKCRDWSCNQEMSDRNWPPNAKNQAPSGRPAPLCTPELGKQVLGRLDKAY